MNQEQQPEKESSIEEGKQLDPGADQSNNLARRSNPGVSQLLKDNAIETELKPAYPDKTSRIFAWSQLIKSIVPFIWIAVILIVIIPLLGRSFLPSSSSPERVLVGKAQLPPDWSKYDQEVVVALKAANAKAEQYASQELDEWVDELMVNVDGSFSDWYLNYFNQKGLEFSSFFTGASSWLVHFVDSNQPSAEQQVAEKATENFQEEFTRRVLRPQIAQLRLERLTQETVDVYLSELSRSLDKVPEKFNLPQPEWDRYLKGLAITIADSGQETTSFSLKALTGVSSLLVLKPLVPVMTKVGSKVAAKMAGKAAAKIAGKTGGVIAAKVGAQFLDPIVGIGIIAWDIWDYHHTVSVTKPILHENILQYLNEVKLSLLNNPQTGVMSVVAQLQDGILRSTSRSSSPS